MQAVAEAAIKETATIAILLVLNRGRGENMVISETSLWSYTEIELVDQTASDANNIPMSPFERIKRIDPDGNEYWSARDLMPLLEYASWQWFKPVLLKAQIACENSGQDTEDHFMGALKIVVIGSDAKREVEDMHLSRYACYLVVQNADPRKGVVALGQTHFAVQTRRQEVTDETLLTGVSEDQRRLLLRREIKKQNTELASAAKGAGVITSLAFAVFQDHGYRGLYNGLTAKDIHKRKKLKKSQHILDHMGSAEFGGEPISQHTGRGKAAPRRCTGQGKCQSGAL